MNDLLFIRHAETNMAGTFCGQSDPPVNETGYRQIEELLESLRLERIDAVYSSDLQRAATTARALARFLAVPCILRDTLREIDFGDWDGLRWEEIEKLDKTYATRWLEDFPQVSAPNGESFMHFEARAMAEAKYLLSECENRIVAVVTHAGVMRTILRSLCGVGDSEAWEQTKSYCCTFRYVHADGAPQEALR
jgi:alpha-ribazole phosphatase/probable phosphoglycerate mutase